MTSGFVASQSSLFFSARASINDVISPRQASEYLVLPSYVKDIRVKADKCPQSPTLAYFKKEEFFELSLKSKKSYEFVISNYQGKFSSKQFRLKFLNKIKSGTSRVRYDNNKV
jgi:hypothetical protein